MSLKAFLLPQYNHDKPVTVVGFEGQGVYIAFPNGKIERWPLHTIRLTVNLAEERDWEKKWISLISKN